MISLFLAVTLAWDPSPTLGAKYHLYYGPNSGEQTIFEDAGTSTTWEVNNLPPGIPIYFVVRAYIEVGIQKVESGPSNEVVFVQPDPTPATGTIQCDIWNNAPGSSISQIPLNRAPDIVGSINRLATSVNKRDNYAQRIRCYLIAPENGQYSFWIASDNQSELWLSTDSDPANKRLIAYLYGWTSPENWTQEASQQSARISFVRGQHYYIEVLHKEGTGGDHLSVGWARPGQTTLRPSEIVPGSVLSPF